VSLASAAEYDGKADEAPADTPVIPIVVSASSVTATLSAENFVSCLFGYFLGIPSPLDNAFLGAGLNATGAGGNALHVQATERSHGTDLRARRRPVCRAERQSRRRPRLET
jgi:hypothetical protein